MSHTELVVVAEKKDLHVVVTKPVIIDVRTMIRPDLKVILAGNIGPRGAKGDTGNTGATGATGPAGPQGEWVSLTQVEYDALSPPDPNTLYVIVE